MDREVYKRLTWVKLYQKVQDAGLVCRKCGISRPTLHKWLQRFNQYGLEGLVSLSRCPKSSPARKVNKTIEEWILDLRQTRNLGARRIQNELVRLHTCKLSLATIHKVLERNKVKPLLLPKRKRVPKSYSRPVPGDRVQMDTMKIAPGLYQYTAIDDCSRWRVLACYPRRTAGYTLKFLERVQEEMPFSIQRIQTDRGKEFFAYKVQEWMKEWAIKFRPVKPASPHLNGKVERSQKTDLLEFWATVDLKDSELSLRLEEWQFYYNWHRAHGALKGKTPVDIVCSLVDKTPLRAEIDMAYQDDKERLKNSNYKLDQQLSKLKRSM